MNRAATIVLVSLAACSIVPEHRQPTAFERDIAVFYDLRDGATDVRVPASGEGLTVLELRTEPPGVRETFAAGERLLHAPAGSLTVHCRYRLLQPEGAPLPSPEQLFPGATSIRDIDPAAK